LQIVETLFAPYRREQGRYILRVSTSQPHVALAISVTYVNLLANLLVITSRRVELISYSTTCSNCRHYYYYATFSFCLATLCCCGMCCSRVRLSVCLSVKRTKRGITQTAPTI